MTQKVPFTIVTPLERDIQEKSEKAVLRVLASGRYSLGEEVDRFESEFADYHGVRYCVGVNSGTSALTLTLKALGVGPGDEVITTPLTWISTSSSISLCEATPVWIDVEDKTYNLDPDKLRRAITGQTVAILVVHLYGQPANMVEIQAIAKENKLLLIEDAAQACGAFYGANRVGTIGDAGCFSFYPSKNLGCYGEAGCVITNNKEIADKVRILRDHGQTEHNEHAILGVNARMESIHGAVLSARLPHLDEWNIRRAAIASKYIQLLCGTPNITLPTTIHDRTAVWHLFVVLVRERNRILNHLRYRGIDCRVHYPNLVPLQPAYAHYNLVAQDFLIGARVASSCLSLPMFPYLTDEQIELVTCVLREVA